MVWTCFFEELLKVVPGGRAGAACSLVDAVAIIGCGLLVALFVPLLAGLGTLLGTLDGDARRRFLAAARGQSKLGRHGAGDMMGGDATPFFGGALGSIGRRVERSI
jgi:hypothetical protein